MNFKLPDLKNITISSGILLVTLVFIFVTPSTNNVQANVDNDYPQCDKFIVSNDEVKDLDEEIKITINASDPDGTPEKIKIYAAAGGQLNENPSDFDCTFADRDDDDFSYYCGDERVWAEIKTEKDSTKLVFTTTYRSLIEQVVDHYHRGQRYWDADYVDFLEDHPKGIIFYKGDDYYKGFDIDDFDPDDYPKDSYYNYYSVYDEDDPEYDDYRYGDFRWDDDYDITNEGIYLSVNVVGQFEEDLCSSNIARNNGRGVYYNGGKWDEECDGGCKMLITYEADKVSDKDEVDPDLCGNGVKDPGEQCDYKYNYNCTRSCENISSDDDDTEKVVITTIPSGDVGGDDNTEKAVITTIPSSSDGELDHKPIQTSFGGNINSKFTSVIGALILISSSASIVMIVKKRKELAKELE